MNAEHLLALYDRVVDTPNAVFRLRRFVLEFAVRGKLVEQNPEDEPASELLKRIVKEKAKLVEVGKVRKTYKLPTQDPVRQYALPDSWEWTTIESVAHIEMGQSPKSVYYNRLGNGIAFFQGKADFGPRHPTPRYWCTKPTKIAEAGDILLSIRAPVGPTNVADRRCCIGRGLAALQPLKGLYYEFMLLALGAFESDLASRGFGTTFVAITKKQLMIYGFPLPPLAEQHRIVAKVNELKALCDRLDEMRAAREKIRDHLTKATLTRLSTPDPDVPTFHSHVLFAVDALPALTTRADQIKHLRKVILSLAVRGKLVEQNPEDEPASELLKRIVKEKAKLVEVGKVRKTYKLPTQDPVRQYALPDSWEWTTIESVAHIEMGQSPKSVYYNRLGNGIAFFQGKADFGPRHPTPRYWCTKPTKIAEAGDILLSIRAPVGPTNVADRRCCIGRGLAALQPLKGLYYEFMLLALGAFESDLASRGFGTTFVAITKKQLMIYGFPLPPLAEQHRIVAKVNELMSLCDQLEADIAGADHTRTQLLKSLLHDELATAVHEDTAASWLEA